MKKAIVFSIFLTLFSCRKTIIIPAKYDTALFSNLPDKNINGKKQIVNYGFGTIKSSGKHYITYPIMYLGTGGEDSVKDAFMIGGFDTSKIKKNILNARLKFYINYVSHSRKRVIFFVRPILSKWKENKITYLDVYQTNQAGAELKPLIEQDENKCQLVYINLRENHKNPDYKKIPFYNNKIVSIDITKIVKSWQKNPGTNHGLLVDPMWKNDLRYCTTNKSNEVTDTGIIEIATTEWYYWNGKVPEDFKIKNGKWKNIKNKAMGKIKYIPRIEITYD